MKYYRTILLIFFLLTIPITNIYATNTTEHKQQISEPKNLYAKAACLIDGTSGRILFEKNAHDSMPMASTTKIMTCIIALENGNLEDLVTVSSNAAKQPDVQLNINTGEQYYLKDLLYSLMLESHNDAAVAIAEHIGGSIEGFASLMNQKSRDLACYDTYFITPNGLDASVMIKDTSGVEIEKTHTTTAADLARIMQYCITESPKKEEFLKITRTASYSFTNIIVKDDGKQTSGSRSFSCNNHNAFLNMMEGALSGKTGFTGKAGYCYIGALTQDGKIFIVALLACGWPNNKTYKWSDTRALMNYGLENYKYRTIWKDITLEPILVQNGIPNSDGANLYTPSYVKLQLNVTEEEKKSVYLLREDEQITVKYEIEKVLQAPVEANTTVGTVTYCLGEEKIKIYPIVTKEAVKKTDFHWYFKRIMDFFLLCN